ncbi:outer membrane lipoprotein carrier protein LolA [Persephonella atlantica]|uniref:Outer membrane lipoprotein carrier protein LolA n=1 Tax=Persephonella atlantica TaxID=2699429 RepID=A0ABS1GH63_9AQUI|nr:outer membrane lipoprotein carrier protein LolA [Persephonella atlantica]MBK3332269.1 outer membrane lipoprotein carrier protein LolA [Persephonella atlantica]
MKKFAVFLLLFSVCSFAFAETLDKLQNKINSYSFIQARFTQITYMKDLQQIERFEGKVYISKPEKVKIIYQKPLKQIYFIDGDSLTIYTPEEKQAIKSKIDKHFFIAKIFRAISSKEGLKKLFSVEKEEKKGNTIDLVMKVKGDEEIKKVEMLLDKDLDIKQIIVWDSEGNRMGLNFYDLVYKKEPQNIYIKLPQDVEIIYY